MRLNTWQRVLVVVAYGLALKVMWSWVAVEGWRPGDGWFNYAPNAGAVFAEGGVPLLVSNVTLRTVGDLVVIALWLVPSVWLLRHAVPTGTAASGSGSEDDGRPH